MRNQAINKSPIYYLNYISNEKVVDSDGNYTGETYIRYTRPILLKTHLGSATGNSQVEIFGTDVKYDKTILLTKKEFKRTGINENSVFFIDKKPIYKDFAPLYNYRVKKIAPSVNEVVIALIKDGN